MSLKIAFINFSIGLRGRLKLVQGELRQYPTDIRSIGHRIAVDWHAIVALGLELQHLDSSRIHLCPQSLDATFKPLAALPRGIGSGSKLIIDIRLYRRIRELR